MKMRARYASAGLLVTSLVAFIGWAYSNLALVNVGLDLKYLESETEVHLARQAEWVIIRSRTGWVFLCSAAAFSVLLAYRWFFVPSKKGE